MIWFHSAFLAFYLITLYPPRDHICHKLIFYVLSYSLDSWGSIALGSPDSTFGTLLFILQDADQMALLHEIFMTPTVRNCHPLYFLHCLMKLFICMLDLPYYVVIS